MVGLFKNKEEKKRPETEEVARPKQPPNLDELKDREIFWTAHDSNSQTKSGDWYFVLWTVALTGAVAAFYLDNPLFGLFLVIAAFSVTIYASRKPKLVTFGVTRRGVVTDTLLYPFSNLSCFYIEEGAPTYLVLQSTKTLQPLITIPVSDDVDISELHAFLVSFLEEKALGVPMYQRIIDRIGF